MFLIFKGIFYAILCNIIDVLYSSKKYLSSHCLLYLFYGGIAFAGVRCGNDIISIGDTKTTVVSKLRECGDILNKDTYTKEIKTQLNKKKVVKKLQFKKGLIFGPFAFVKEEVIVAIH
ncbi:DUF2845 domain-containing protein [uncultured Desulfobacter sp.]|uniref:DUF2845 domain-containing protein n=1 Tax=uncultured Desulfobacter sp. TaxID=240139 RepID=UPI0037487E16